MVTSSEVMSSEPKRRPAVMMDVARLAGVSHQTVSRVLNNSSSVSELTRERVLQAIAQLDYRRNGAARALVTRRSHTVGVISFDTTLYGPVSTLFALEEAARDAGYVVSVASLRRMDRTEILDAVDRLIAQSVEGILVIAPQRPVALALQHISLDVPVVAVQLATVSSHPVVGIDQVQGAREATRHLLSLGHRTVWHVTGPADSLDAEGRLEGWREEMASAKVPVPDPLTGDWSPISGYRAGQALAERDDVTAVFVANDQMALGVVRALTERGIGVPHDVSVVGFDDIPEAAFFTPPLTTIRQDFAAVGRLGMQSLLRRLTGAEPEHLTVVRPELVIRHSTAAPPR